MPLPIIDRFAPCKAQRPRFVWITPRGGSLARRGCQDPIDEETGRRSTKRSAFLRRFLALYGHGPASTLHS